MGRAARTPAEEIDTPGLGGNTSFMSNPLRNLPSIHEVLENPALKALLDRISRSAVVSTVLDEVRHEVQTAASDRTLPSASDLVERIARRIVEGQSPGPRPVINATGLLLMGGLGRPPLAEEAIAAMAAAARDYASFEWNLALGRTCRPSEAVEELLRELCGAEAALTVNSDAAATLLTLAGLAAGREVIVSRGHMVDRGDGWRLPDLLSASGRRSAKSARSTTRT